MAKDTAARMGTVARDMAVRMATSTTAMRATADPRATADISIMVRSPKATAVKVTAASRKKVTVRLKTRQKNSSKRKKRSRTLPR